MDLFRPSPEDVDVFSLDMDKPKDISKIAAMFENTTVFVTGGTGYLGKMFIEKLLRFSKTVKVLILVRPKKGVDVNTRFGEMFEGPNMVPLKLKNPHFKQQIRLLPGDCRERDLGLSEEDKHLIISDVNFIIHCAATVRFDQFIRTAAHINVRAVKDLICMARQMKDLRAFLHVSTAFSFCPLDQIEEKFYEPPLSPDELLEMVDTTDEETLRKKTPEIIKDWPNTYSFTKAIAEDLLKNEVNRLPVAVLRPSIVIGSKSEPVAGWIDNFYGITGVFAAITLGFVRIFMAKLHYKTDIIPSDYVMNSGFAVLWNITQKRSISNHEDSPKKEDNLQTSVYNIVSSVESPIDFGTYAKLVRKVGVEVASVKILWYPMIWFTSNPRVYEVLSFLLQLLPAYIIDAVLFCMGKKPWVVNAQKLYNTFMEVICYFSMREWFFQNRNTRMLWDKLEPNDRKLYPFSMENFDWENYMHYYLRGCRVFLLNDPMETVPEGKRKMRRLFYLNVIVLSLLAVLISSLFYFLLKIILLVISNIY